jgi:hypothetical protein
MRIVLKEPTGSWLFGELRNVQFPDTLCKKEIPGIRGWIGQEIAASQNNTWFL